MYIRDILRRAVSKSDVVAVHKSIYISLGEIALKPALPANLLSRPTCSPGVNEMKESSHHVVVVGAGFGGLEFTRALDGAPVRI
ncbi:MAG: hypothetical protein E5X61_09545, partial [Mesorhizobium sp.]